MSEVLDFGFILAALNFIYLQSNLNQMFQYLANDQ